MPMFEPVIRHFRRQRQSHGSQIVDSTGGRSQLSQITTVIIVLLVLLFLTDLLPICGSNAVSCRVSDRHSFD